MVRRAFFPCVAIFLGGPDLVVNMLLFCRNTKSVDGFGITENAEKFDNDTTDDQNHHETVVQIEGQVQWSLCSHVFVVSPSLGTDILDTRLQSRGLVWLPVPIIGTVLAKLTEAMNK
jgi:hypothetical protein